MLGMCECLASICNTVGKNSHKSKASNLSPHLKDVDKQEQSGVYETVKYAREWKVQAEMHKVRLKGGRDPITEGTAAGVEDAPPWFREVWRRKWF